LYLVPHEIIKKDKQIVYLNLFINYSIPEIASNEEGIKDVKKRRD
jgi:hypothetical protein